jgi:hypothetical protein
MSKSSILLGLILGACECGLGLTPARRPPAGEPSEQLLPANQRVAQLALTAERSRAKVVLWFWEQCPSWKKWPDMYAVAKKFEGEPVVFIAVNSGNSRDEVAQYAKGVDLPWPVIVDPTREFEKLWLDNEISLQNIHQLGIILPSGQKTMGNWSEFENSVQKAAEVRPGRSIRPPRVPAPTAARGDGQVRGA